MQVCTSLQTDNHTSTHHSVFYRPDAFLPPNQQRQSTEGTLNLLKGRVPELIPVLCSQPADDVSHKPGDTVPLLSARPAVTLATLKRAATNFAAW